MPEKASSAYGIASSTAMIIAPPEKTPYHAVFSAQMQCFDSPMNPCQ
jgi:hypothetical protein